MNIQDVVKDVFSKGANIISFRLTHVPSGCYAERQNIHLKNAKETCEGALKELEQKVEKKKHVGNDA